MIGTGLWLCIFLVAACCAASFVLMQRTRRELAKFRNETARELEVLAQAIQELTSRQHQASVESAAGNKHEIIPEPAPVSKPTQPLTSAKKEEITPELLVVLAAAVTVYLGKKVRIRSAKMLQSPYEIVNPWSQQGRVFVQASHVLR
jgi:methylmalonyl-CoA carboxyltransferase 12S subunit